MNAALRRVHQRMLRAVQFTEGWYERRLKEKHPSGWHSFDRAPWRHPWLTRDNLERMRDFSQRIRKEASVVAERFEGKVAAMRFAFVGNMANSSYQRMRALGRIGFSATLYPHPFDTSVMSQPEWEEFDGVLPEGVTDRVGLLAAAGDMGDVGEVRRIEPRFWKEIMAAPELARLSDYVRWREYFCYAPTFEALRRESALFTVQTPYLAYLSRRPYVATHMGGDIWYECSRGDPLGALQRQAFGRAAALTISNPWSPAFARRYGMRNMVQLPMILDPERYCPGPARWREEWRARVGGDFFVLSTARLDDRYKGSNVALEGFAQLAARRPGARLALLGWGRDLKKYEERLRELGIAERTVFLPPSGKPRLIQYLRSADCLLDQFVLGYFGLSALEAMSTGLPVVMRLEAGQYDAFFDTGAPPVLQATTAAEAAAQLERLAGDETFRRNAGAQALAWLERSASPLRWGKSYRDLLVAAAVGHRFSFRDSPLRAPLAADEIEYHREELAHAPAYPNYH